MLLTEFQSWLASEKKIVDERLGTLLAPVDTFPAELHHAIWDAVLGGGKRLRAALVRGLCAALGGRAEDALTVGCAVECYHAATLVLDDLPCMDNAATRRGRPALHVAYPESTAVLAAEALIMRAVELVSRPGHDGLPADAPAADLVAALAAATGASGLMAGQYLDLAYQGRQTDVETLEAMHNRKTGRLFRWCADAAAKLAKAEAAHAAAARVYADAFGLAFQISDDMLDATGDAATLGKPTGQDAGKSTYVTHFGIEGARARLEDAIKAARAALSTLPGDTAPLAALADYLLTRTS